MKRTSLTERLFLLATGIMFGISLCMVLSEYWVLRCATVPVTIGAYFYFIYVKFVKEKEKVRYMEYQSFVEICLRQGKYNVYLICFDDLYAIEENVSWDEAVKSAIKSSKKHNRTVRVFASGLNDSECDEMLLVAIVMNAGDNAQLFISKDILDNPLQIVKCAKCDMATDEISLINEGKFYCGNCADILRDMVSRSLRKKLMAGVTYDELVNEAASELGITMDELEKALKGKDKQWAKKN